MAKKFRADDYLGTARTQTAENLGWGQVATVPGDCQSLNAEVAIDVTGDLVTLGKPVRTLVVRSTVAGYVARAATELVGAPNGLVDGGRFFLAAGELRTLPWFQDEVHFKAASGSGTLYVEGRL